MPPSIPPSNASFDPRQHRAPPAPPPTGAPYYLVRQIAERPYYETYPGDGSYEPTSRNRSQYPSEAAYGDFLPRASRRSRPEQNNYQPDSYNPDEAPPSGYGRGDHSDRFSPSAFSFDREYFRTTNRRSGDETYGGANGERRYPEYRPSEDPYGTDDADTYTGPRGSLYEKDTHQQQKAEARQPVIVIDGGRGSLYPGDMQDEAARRQQDLTVTVSGSSRRRRR